MRKTLQLIILAVIMAVSDVSAQEGPGIPIPAGMPEWLIFKDGHNYLIYQGDTLMLDDKWYWTTYRSKAKDYRKYNVEEAIEEMTPPRNLQKYNSLGMPYLFYDRFKLNLTKIKQDFAYELFFRRKTDAYVRVIAGW